MVDVLIFIIGVLCGVVGLVFFGAMIVAINPKIHP